MKNSNKEVRTKVGGEGITQNTQARKQTEAACTSYTSELACPHDSFTLWSQSICSQLNWFSACGLLNCLLDSGDGC